MTIRAETHEDQDRARDPDLGAAGWRPGARPRPIRQGRTPTPDDFVFGDVVGRQVTDVKRAWETAVLKAHGHTPKWDPRTTLAPASREAFRAANLTFHDLRHEAGSRLLEAGWPLHNVAHMLGHANIAQTRPTSTRPNRIAGRDAST